MSIRQRAAATTMLSVALSGGLVAGCSTSGPGSAGAPVAHTSEPVTFFRAGITVRIPSGCDPDAVSPARCSGLRSLKLASIRPIDDLIRSGIYRKGDAWLGMRVIGTSYVFATSRERPILVQVLGSATAE